MGTPGQAQLMTNSSLLSEESQAVPPFRSATDFPIKPKPELLASLYPELLQALKDANAARRMLRASMEEKKQFILEMRAELERLENDFAIESQARLRLHAMNEHLVAVLKEVDGFVEEAAAVVEGGHQVPRSRLGSLIEQLKSLVKRWRAFKRQQRAMPVIPDGESLGD